MLIASEPSESVKAKDGFLNYSMGNFQLVQRLQAQPRVILSALPSAARFWQ